MPKYFFESSAFTKRYKQENGSILVNQLFAGGFELFYLNLAIFEISKVFWRLKKHRQNQDPVLSPQEIQLLENQFAADLLNMSRIEFTEEMLNKADKILEQIWVPNIFDLAQLSAYLIAKEEYCDLLFVCSDRRSKLVAGAKFFVDEKHVIIPEYQNVSSL